MTEEQQRPPPIIVGVSGIEARSDMVEAPEPQSAVDWFRLFRLPSFGMFWMNVLFGRLAWTTLTSSKNTPANLCAHSRICR